MTPKALVALLLVSVLLLALGGSPAAGAQSHELVGSFCSAGTGAGQCSLTRESGVAVDQSNGYVYVADTGNHRVEKFGPSGEFLAAWGWGVSDDKAESEVCTSACQAGLPGSGAGQLEKPTFVAVDNTPGGAGDVYVADLGSVANEQQTVTVSGAGGGSFTLSFTSPVDATTTNGSNVITMVQSAGSRIGDPISGPSIPAGTTIVSAGGSGSNVTLTLSANATASGRTILGVTETTGPIASHVTSEELQTALESIAALRASRATVMGAAGGPYTVKFPGYTATDLALMTCDGTGLSSAGASCTVATAVKGFNTARVQKFDSFGDLITGWGVNLAGPSWGGMPPGGEIDGTTPGLIGLNEHFGRLEGVGVNPQGDLLVLSHPEIGSPQISEWSQSLGENININIDEGAGTYGNGGPIGIAVDPAGHVYMGEGVPPELEPIQTSLCDTEEPSGRCPGSNAHEGWAYHENFVVDPGPATGAAVDPSTEDVYVAHFNPDTLRSDVASYDHEGNPLETFGGGEIESTREKEITEPRSIAVSGFAGSQSDVYVADRGDGRIEIFAPGGNRDALTVTRVGNGLGSVTSQPAGIACPFTCSGSFPRGGEVTLTATAPEHSSFVGWSGGGCSGAGVCQIALSAVTSVTATFAYDQPVLTIGAASAVTRHTATLNGEVNPEGDAFSCRFEYGATTAYGAEAHCLTQSGSGVSPMAVSAELWDLAASTTYHYRLVSANSGGATYGPDQTFTTESETCAINATLCLPPPLTCATDAVLCPPPPSCATDATLCSSPPLKCRRGYVKKTVRGKPTCVKAPPTRKCRRGYVKKTVRGKPTCVKAKKPTAKKKRG